MSERNKHIDKLFRQAMENHTEEPPAHVWDNIENRLNNPAAKAPVRIWWFWAVLGIMLVSTTAIVASYNTGKEKVMSATTNNVEQAEQLASAVQQPKDNRHNPNYTANQDVVNNAQKLNHKQQENKTTSIISTPAKNTQSNKQSLKQIQSRVKPLSQTVTTSIAKQKVEAVVNTPPKIKKEPYYLAAKKAKQNKIEVKAGVVEKARLPEMIATEKISTQGITPISSVALASPVVSSVSSGNLLASNEKMLLPKNQKPTAKNPALYNSEYEDESQVMHEANYHDTTKKKRKKKVADTSQKNEDNILNQSSEPESIKLRRPLPVEFGIKAGYSMGTNSTWAANKFLIAPYAEYRVSDKFSIVFQPAYQTGNPKTGSLANENTSYYEVTNQSLDSTFRLARGYVDSSIITPNPPDTIFRSYTYTQQYDSVHVQYGVVNKQLWDIEMPLLMKYKVHKNISILAGVSATYSSVLQTKEEVNRYNMSKSVTDNLAPETFFVTAPNQPLPAAPAPKAYENVFANTGTPLSSFQPRTITTAKNFFRYGYMLGVSATYKERLMFDLLWHQTGVDATQVPDKDLQKIYKQPYIRVTIGYKLSK